MFLSIGIGLISLLIIYMRWIRPWQLRWGATDEELTHPMPGDELLEKPHFNATRAVTINARPEHIWPWIMQIGFTRAGWYSYDIIDNLGRPSATEIIPELQDLKVGDKVPLSRWTFQVVKEIIPYKTMLWIGDYEENAKATDGTWVWGLYPLDEQRTRLVTRLRGRYHWFSPWILLMLVVDVGDIIMMRKCMLGIKQRSEVLAGQEKMKHQTIETTDDMLIAKA